MVIGNITDKFETFEDITADLEKCFSRQDKSVIDK